MMKVLHGMEEKYFVKRILEPVISCLREQYATTAPARHTVKGNRQDL